MMTWWWIVTRMWELMMLWCQDKVCRSRVGIRWPGHVSDYVSGSGDQVMWVITCWDHMIGRSCDQDITEVAMSMTETSSKIHKPKSYDKAINNSIHDRWWREVIEKELQNLKNHQTWEYNELPLGQKGIGSKLVFKVKYHPNGSVARFKAQLVAQSFSQILGINFAETFVLTVRRE